jgi:hypothetical protein
MPATWRIGKDGTINNKQQERAENTQQPGIKGMASGASNRPVATVKAERGCSVGPDTKFCWREMRSRAPMGAVEGTHECGRLPCGAASRWLR